MRTFTYHAPELLEGRIAPASLVTLPDIDGDTITVKTSTGRLVVGENVELVDGLLRVDLGGFAAGTTLSIMAAKGSGGDGFVNVGQILASGINLGAVMVDGDLGRITAGSGAAGAVAVASLKAFSMGVQGAPGGEEALESQLSGRLGSLTLISDLKRAAIYTQSTGHVMIGGSVIGGVTPESGFLFASTTIGNVMIGGDLVGGSELRAGAVSAELGLGNVIIKGSVLGGSGEESGALRVDESGGKIASITVGGDVIGGTSVHSARLYANEGIGRIVINGDVRGGSSSYSARIFTGGESGITSITIGGSLVGGGGVESGMIDVNQGLGSLTIKGNLTGTGTMAGYVHVGSVGAISISGQVTNSSLDDDNGAIRVDGSAGKTSLGSLTGLGASGLQVGGNLASLTVKGDVTRNVRVGLTAGAISIGGHFDGSLGLGASEGSAAVGGGISVKVGKDLRGQIISPTSLTGGVMVSGDLTGSIILGVVGNSTPELGDEVLVVANSGAIRIGGSLQGGVVSVSGTLASLTVGQDVVGGDQNLSGSVQTFGDIGSITVGGSLLGGTGSNTGGLGSYGHIRSARIGGDIVGTLSGAGQLSANSFGSVTVGGSLRGGTELFSGFIATLAGDIASVKIGGDIVGGSGSLSGVVVAGFSQFFGGSDATGAIKSVTIGGSIRGGTITDALPGTSSAEVSFSGAVVANHLASLTVGKDLRGGYDFTDETDIRNAAGIFVVTAGTISIKGGMYGTTTATGSSSPQILVTGQNAAEGATANVVLKGVTVGRNVEQANILVGINPANSSALASQQVGAISIGGDWVTSRLLVGALPGPDSEPGTVDDVSPVGSLISRIAALTIKGRIFGTAGGMDTYTIAAEAIGSLKIGARTVALADPVTPIALSTTGDVFAVLLPPPGV